jgi:hypothetical protein
MNPLQKERPLVVGRSSKKGKPRFGVGYSESGV